MAKKVSGDPAARGAPDKEYDVIVIGFGAAGASAAIEAADAGASVLAVDRFGGGGSARMSGGVVYAGGGTRAQLEGGFSDSFNAMLDYLRVETGGEAGDTAVKAFCRGSVDIIPWLEKMGVRFASEFYPGQAFQPPGGFGLFFSGNEIQLARKGPSIPRGHVPLGAGMGGSAIYRAMEQRARRLGVRMLFHTKATELVVDRKGAVTGARFIDLGRNPAVRLLHAALYRAGFLSAACRKLLMKMEARFGVPLEVRARGGVVLCGGGFVFNREMVRERAPAFARCLPLGTPGDDGSAIMLGAAAGGGLARMDSCAAFRFFTPPREFSAGVLVNDAGERFCDESLSGAPTGRAIAAQRGGRAWLVTDSQIMDSARAAAEEDEPFVRYPLSAYLSGEMNHLLFRKYITRMNLKRNLVRAGTLGDMEARLGLPRGSLGMTLDRYNRDIEESEADAMGKKGGENRRYVVVPPFYAVDCSLGNRLFPDPCMTLGGLTADPAGQKVLRAGGRAVPGLYAAGRTAAGICTGSCAVGLSLAESIVTGREAGRHAARAAQSGPVR